MTICSSYFSHTRNWDHAFFLKKRQDGTVIAKIYDALGKIDSLPIDLPEEISASNDFSRLPMEEKFSWLFDHGCQLVLKEGALQLIPRQQIKDFNNFSDSLEIAITALKAKLNIQQENNKPDSIASPLSAEPLIDEHGHTLKKR